MTKFKVTADTSELTSFLKGALTEDELKLLSIKPETATNPFAPQPRRGEPLSVAVLVWVGGAVATGMAYDVVKALSLKVWNLLETKYGADKVKKDESAD